MILTIDTDKESPERLRQIARFLESLSPTASEPQVAEDFSFSEDAFSAVFDQPDEKPKRRNDDDGFSVMPY